jgi:hypothetical protein
VTLKEARALQKEIPHYCTVPLGHGPDGYYVQMPPNPDRPDARFHSRAEWAAWDALMQQKWSAEKVPLRDTRSPIARMIDQACGLP